MSSRRPSARSTSNLEIASTTPRRASRTNSARNSASGPTGGDQGSGFAWDAAESALVQGIASARQGGRRPVTPTRASAASTDTMWDSVAGAVGGGQGVPKPDKSVMQELDELRRKNAKLQKKVADAEVLGTKVDRLVEYFEEREDGFAKQIRGLEESEAFAEGSVERYATECTELKQKENKAKRELRHVKGTEVRESEEWLSELQALTERLHGAEAELEADHQAHQDAPSQGQALEVAEIIAQEERLAEECSGLHSELGVLQKQPSPAVLERTIDLLQGREVAEERAFRLETRELEEAMTELRTARGSQLKVQQECSALRRECAAVERNAALAEELTQLKQTQQDAHTTSRPAVIDEPQASGETLRAAESRWSVVTLLLCQAEMTKIHRENLRQLQAKKQGTTTPMRRVSSSRGNAALYDRLAAAEKLAQAYATEAMSMQEAAHADLQRRIRLCSRWSRPGSTLQALQQELIQDTARYLEQSRVSLTALGKTS